MAQCPAICQDHFQRNHLALVSTSSTPLPPSIRYYTRRGPFRPHRRPLLTRRNHQGPSATMLPITSFYSRQILSRRLVIDLSALNKRIPCPTFSMTTASKLRGSLPTATWFTTLDISNAFLHVPLHPRFRKYVAFSLRNQLYFFTVTPFGLNISPLIFTKRSRFPLNILHRQGISCSVYLDDWLIWAPNPTQSAHFTQLALTLLTDLRFLVNTTKSKLTPSQTVTYLGVSWDGLNAALLPSDRIRVDMATLTSSILATPLLSKKTYQRFLGKANFIAPLIHAGQHHFKLLVFLARVAPQFQSPVILHDFPAFKKEISWWGNANSLSSPTPLRDPPATITLWTDASDLGWGAVTSTNLTLSRQWSVNHLKLHITAKETLAIILALEMFPLPPFSSILIRSDSSVACSLINKTGSNKSQPLNLHDPLQVDLFSHPGNNKLPQFVCAFHHPHAAATDALSTDWSRWTQLYLFPPKPLLPSVLRKLKTFQGHGVLIIPDLPSALWWSDVPSHARFLDLTLSIDQLIQDQTITHSSQHYYAFLALSF